MNHHLLDCSKRFYCQLQLQIFSRILLFLVIFHVHWSQELHHKTHHHLKDLSHQAQAKHNNCEFKQGVARTLMFGDYDRLYHLLRLHHLDHPKMQGTSQCWASSPYVLIHLPLNLFFSISFCLSFRWCFSLHPILYKVYLCSNHCWRFLIVLHLPRNHRIQSSQSSHFPKYVHLICLLSIPIQYQYWSDKYGLQICSKDRHSHFLDSAWDHLKLNKSQMWFFRMKNFARKY